MRMRKAGGMIMTMMAMMVMGPLLFLAIILNEATLSSSFMPSIPYTQTKPPTKPSTRHFVASVNQDRLQQPQGQIVLDAKSGKIPVELKALLDEAMLLFASNHTDPKIITPMERQVMKVVEDLVLYLHYQSIYENATAAEHSALASVRVSMQDPFHAIKLQIKEQQSKQISSSDASDAPISTVPPPAKHDVEAEANVNDKDIDNDDVAANDDTDITPLGDLTIAQLAQSLDQLMLDGYDTHKGSADSLDQWRSNVQILASELERRSYSVEDIFAGLPIVNDRFVPGEDDDTDDAADDDDQVETIDSGDAVVSTTRASQGSKAGTTQPTATVVTSVPTTTAGAMTSTKTLANGAASRATIPEDLDIPFTLNAAMKEDEENISRKYDIIAQKYEESKQNAAESIVDLLNFNNIPVLDEDEEKTADAVTAVVTVASIGAATVTGMPLLAAGTVVAPLISRAILYAKEKADEQGNDKL